jgi:hypothetical protein
MLLGCAGDSGPLLPEVHAAACASPSPGNAEGIPGCLLAQGVIDQADYQRAALVLSSAITKAEVLRSIRGTENFDKAGRIAKSLELLTSLQQRGLLQDSARFHRIIDVISVAVEIVEGRTSGTKGKLRPAATPHLVWYDYPKIGAFFQPVTTSQTVAHLLPRQSFPTDSLLGLANRLYGYALWREHGGRRFPVWEYLFPWSSGGIRLESPWVSGMAQGLVMSVFTEAYRRTQLPEWRTRAYEVFNSFQVTWSKGGVMIDDTTRGYWWEEFDPRIMIWNGSVQALVDVGFLWTVTGDTAVRRVFDRGIEALKYYTPRYDTGSWTLYSLTQGHNTVAYHNYHVALMDVLFSQTNDPWFESTADRWRGYLPPPGVD